MKRSYIKHTAGFFFVCLFIFNGLYSVMPSMFANDDSTIENVLGTETEKNNAEKGEKLLKEIYLNDIYHGELLAVHFPTLTKILAAEQSLYKKDVHLSIPTPPPKLS